MSATVNGGENNEEQVLIPVGLWEGRALLGVMEKHLVPLGMSGLSFPASGCQGPFWELAEENHPLKLSRWQVFSPFCQ